MKDRKHQPVYKIGVASRLCGVHPQTLRAYERLGLIAPAREGEKNRLYSEADVERVKQIQRLTQDMGVNLAGVEIILKLLDNLEEVRMDFEQQLREYIAESERRLAVLLRSSNAPIRKGEGLLPIPRIRVRKPLGL